MKYFWQINKGLSQARNFGITKVTGSFIAFLDADDEFLPNKIDQQISHFHKFPEVMMTHTDYMVIDDNGKNLGYRETSFYQDYKYPKILLA